MFGRAGWTKDSSRDFYRWILSLKDNLISSLTIYQTLTVLKGKLIKLPKEKPISCHTKPQCIWYHNFVILKNFRLCKDDQTLKYCSVPVLILLSGEVARSLSGGSAVEITQEQTVKMSDALNSKSVGECLNPSPTSLMSRNTKFTTFGWNLSLRDIICKGKGVPPTSPLKALLGGAIFDYSL